MSWLTCMRMRARVRWLSWANRVSEAQRVAMTTTATPANWSPSPPSSPRLTVSAWLMSATSAALPRPERRLATGAAARSHRDERNRKRRRRTRRSADALEVPDVAARHRERLLDRGVGGAAGDGVDHGLELVL